MNIRRVLYGLVVLGTLLSPDSGVAGCRYSDGPQCTGSCPNGTWMRAYSSWCESCGGKMWQDNTGGGCKLPAESGSGSSSGGSSGASSIVDSINQAFAATAAQSAASAQIHRESTQQLNSSQEQSAAAAGQRLQRASQERAAAQASKSAALGGQLSGTGTPGLSFDLSSGLAARQLVATEKADRPLKNAGRAEADSETARLGFDTGAKDAGGLDTSAVRVPAGQAAREEKIKRDPRMVAAVKKLDDLKAEREKMDAEMAKLKQERNAAKDKEQMSEATAKLDDKNRDYQKKLLEITKETENVKKTRETVSVSVDAE